MAVFIKEKNNSTYKILAKPMSLPNKASATAQATKVTSKKKSIKKSK